MTCWDGQQVRTLIGTGLFAFGDRDGRGTEAQLQHPSGLAYRDGALWLADTYNGSLRRYDLATQRLETVLQGLQEPVGLDWLGRQWLVTEAAAHRVATFAPDTQQVRPFTLFRCEGPQCIVL